MRLVVRQGLAARAPARLRGMAVVGQAAAGGKGFGATDSGQRKNVSQASARGCGAEGWRRRRLRTPLTHRARASPARAQDAVAVEGQSDGPRRVKFKGKKSMRQGAQPAAPAQQQFLSADAPQAGQQQESLVEALEFEARLKALKAGADAKRQALAAQSGGPALLAGGGSILDASPLEGGGGGAIDYDRPPPLAKTLFNQDTSSANKEYEGGKIGPSQARVVQRQQQGRRGQSATARCSSVTHTPPPAPRVLAGGPGRRRHCAGRHLFAQQRPL